MATTIVAAVAAGGVGLTSSVLGAGADTRAAAADAPDGQVVQGRTFKLHRAHLGYARALDKRTPIPEKYRHHLNQGDPDGEGEGESTGPAPKSPTAPDPAKAPTKPSTATAATANVAHVYRHRYVAKPDSVISEPTSANLADVSLVTYNTYAALLSANGAGTKRFVNPYTAFPQDDGGLCCDQRAYSTRHNGSEILFWLQDYYPKDFSDPLPGSGRLRLIVYQNREELTDQKDFCQLDIKPSDVGYPGSRTWWDYPQISSTGQYLFISADGKQVSGNASPTAPPGSRDPSTELGSMVMRIPLDDLDDPDSGNCDSTPLVHVFTGGAAGFHPSFVQASDTVMTWAFHSLTDPDALTIAKVPDGAASATLYQRPITHFTPTDPTLTAHCVVPDGTNPCAFLQGDLKAANFDGESVGWFWHVREGAGHPFPYVRGARFTVGTLTLLEEPELSDPHHAIVYPAMGVNDVADTAITAYRMGPNDYPTAMTALVDNFATNWSTVQFKDLHQSLGGSIENRWGDYQSVNRYLGCERTWAAVYGAQGDGNFGTDASVRFAWLGQAGDGCPDLSIRTVSVEPSASDPRDLIVNYRIKNTGSATAGESRTRFYLSRDTRKDGDDIRLPAGSDAQTIDQGGTLDRVAIEHASTDGRGAFYLLACADDRKEIDEVAEAKDDNCLAADQTVTLVRLVRGASPVRVNARAAERGTAFSGGSRIEVGVTIDAARGSRNAPLTFGLSPTGEPNELTRAGHSAVRLASASAAAKRTARRRFTVRRTVVIPHGLRHRRQFIVVCTARKPRAGRCLASRRPIWIRGARDR